MATAASSALPLLPRLADSWPRRQVSVGRRNMGHSKLSPQTRIIGSGHKGYRSNGIRASSDTSTSSTAAPVKIPALKKQLEESLNQTETNLSDESLAIILELESLNPTPQPAKRPDLWGGPFKMLNSTMQNVLYRGAVVNLGRASFNAFKPTDLSITFEEVYNDVGVHSPDAYNTIVSFTVTQSGLPPLKGILFTEAKASPSTTNPDTRVDVEFLKSTLMPRDSSVDLESWIGVFGKENDMDENGVAGIKLPSPKGWLELTYLDQDLRITHGNFGSVVVVKRLDAPAIPVSV